MLVRLIEDIEIDGKPFQRGLAVVFTDNVAKQLVRDGRAIIEYLPTRNTSAKLSTLEKRC